MDLHPAHPPAEHLQKVRHLPGYLYADPRRPGHCTANKKGSQLWRWNDFSGFKETAYFFHVYFNARSFFLIPKDSFKDITEIQEARKLLKERIKG
ncbi:YcxB family protein [Puia sp. P3]|uniref:YcxB family protein n=1 Tax=Puia sp. P3 TaxID=3423952 RepID=UPI003D664ACD